MLAHFGKPLIDVRSPEEYNGERTTAPPTPRRAPFAAATSRPAASVPWARAAAEDGTFKTRAELDAIYRDEVGLQDGDDVIAYCRIGERSSHTWFVLTHLLGFENVRNYDGSWTEWGSAVRVPIVTGAERGEVPARAATEATAAVGEWNRWTPRPLPARLAETREDFLALGVKDRLPAAARVLERAARAARAVPRPPRPPRAGRGVPVAGLHLRRGRARLVHMHATAPAESPTTRGFASILVQGLDGLSIDEVLDGVPADYPQSLGLTEAVSPLRVRGMTGMLGRVKRQVAERVAAGARPATSASLGGGHAQRDLGRPATSTRTSRGPALGVVVPELRVARLLEHLELHEVGAAAASRREPSIGTKPSSSLCMSRIGTSSSSARATGSRSSTSIGAATPVRSPRRAAEEARDHVAELVGHPSACPGSGGCPPSRWRASRGSRPPGARAPRPSAAPPAARSRRPSTSP